MARTTKKTLSFKEKLEIYELLKLNIEILDDGYCKYHKPSVTDATIVAMLDPERVTEKHVANVRKDNFGRLRDQTKPNNSETLDRLVNTVGSLSAALAEANHKIDQLTAKHDKLCQSLSINKVLDVRHLVMLNEAHPAFRTNGKEKQPQQ